MLRQVVRTMRALHDAARASGQAKQAQRMAALERDTLRKVAATLPPVGQARTLAEGEREAHKQGHGRPAAAVRGGAPAVPAQVRSQAPVRPGGEGMER